MQSKVKKWVDHAARRAGLSVVPTWRLNNLPAAEHLRSLFDFLSIDCVFDVGANQGQYRDFLREDVGFEKRIVSFEPIPGNAAAMRARAAGDTEWMVEAMALGSRSGVAQFNVMVGSQFSSFLRPDHSNVSEFEESNKVEERIEVPVRTLDEFVASAADEFSGKNIYLKMDTQGFDLEVLKGATETLKSVCALQSEASVKPIYEKMPDYATTIKTIQALDFELSGIFPNNAGHFPLLIEFDCYFVAKRFVAK